MPFHPYYTMKDLFAIVVFCIPFAWFVFFAPDILGHPDNYIQANPLVTPPQSCRNGTSCRSTRSCAPSTSTSILDSKLLGVIAFGGSILILFFLPWLDTCKVRSGTFRPMFKWFYWVFVVELRAAHLVRRADAGHEDHRQSARSPTPRKLSGVLLLPTSSSSCRCVGRFETPRPLAARLDLCDQPVLKPRRRHELMPGTAQTMIKISDHLRCRLLWLAIGRGVSAGGAGHEVITVERQPWSFGGICSASTTSTSCSAASRCSRPCARTATGRRLLAFRNLEEEGGPGFSEEQVKALAAELHRQRSRGRGRHPQGPAVGPLAGAPASQRRGSCARRSAWCRRICR